MSDERLVELPELRGSCTSSEALEVSERIAIDEGATSRAWQIGTEDGLDADGRSVRWEVRYDLRQRRQELVVTLGFPMEETTGDRPLAVAAVRVLPFPAEGSQLARMAADGQMSGRRLRAVWRQQLREHEPLPESMPDSSLVAAAVAPEPVRVARARITRLRGFVWVTTTPGRTRHLRFDGFD